VQAFAKLTKERADAWDLYVRLNRKWTRIIQSSALTKEETDEALRLAFPLRDLRVRIGKQ